MKPLDLVAMMVLENGQRWGDAATDDQWADMRALLEPSGGPRWHFWLRARGRSKTFDAGAATVAFMLAGPAGAGDELYAAAAGRDQAGLLAGKIAGITRNTPELAGAVEIQQQRVITPRSGAVLQVLSSELATSWGKTPLWLFVDEICNHENTAVKEDFVTSLLTSLPKRPDSHCLIGSTPSSTSHWSYGRWQRSEESPLWRASVVAGPAPWQNPAELAELRADLPEFQWLRLFECQWASADDTLADEQALADCTRETLVLHPLHGTEYVVTWDIGWKKDHSAVAVLHMGTRGGRKAVICDRLESWVPSAGREVRISDVMARAAELAAEYNGALMFGDPHEAWQTVQDLKAAGYNIRPAETTASANSVRAKLMLRLVRDRALEIPPDSQLAREFLSLRLAEGSTPGVVRLSSDGSAKGHYDRVMTLLYGTGELLSRPGASWRDFQGVTRQCEHCDRWYIARSPVCTWCKTPNPEAQARREETREYVPQPGSWASAYIPAGSRKCDAGHFYPAERGETCPRCHNSASSTTMPAAFGRALGFSLRR